MTYLVDTNIIIFLCNSKSAKLEAKFKAFLPEEFSVSSITVAELIYGVFKSMRQKQNLEAVIKILSPFTVLDFDSRDAWEYGRIRAELEAKGQIIGCNDLLIAAQASRRGYIVVTNNTSEYSRIQGLRVEDWTE